MASPAIDFPQLAARLGRRIDDALDQATRLPAGCPDRLREAIRHSLLAPAKRLRPCLVLMAAEACGSNTGRAMPAACAVEMVHTYSLIHDDLPAMDDDDLRRGLPSCHAKFDEATAILAGDALLAMAFESLTNLQPPEVVAACCRQLAQAAGPTALVGGQADDLAAEQNGGDRESLEAIHSRKTGAMFRVSLRLGGIVAQAERRQIEALDQYGKQLGLAFQIVDDLLDFAGDESAMGKRTGKDSDRGKLTFPGLLGVDASRREAQRLVEQACAAARTFEDRASELEALAHFVLKRNR